MVIDFIFREYMFDCNYMANYYLIGKELKAFFVFIFANNNYFIASTNVTEIYIFLESRCPYVIFLILFPLSEVVWNVLTNTILTSSKLSKNGVEGSTLNKMLHISVRCGHLLAEFAILTLVFWTFLDTKRSRSRHYFFNGYKNSS